MLRAGRGTLLLWVNFKSSKMKKQKRKLSIKWILSLLNLIKILFYSINSPFILINKMRCLLIRFKIFPNNKLEAQMISCSKILKFYPIMKIIMKIPFLRLCLNLSFILQMMLKLRSSLSPILKLKLGRSSSKRKLKA